MYNVSIKNDGFLIAAVSLGVCGKDALTRSHACPREVIKMAEVIVLYAIKSRRAVINQRPLDSLCVCVYVKASMKAMFRSTKLCIIVNVSNLIYIVRSVA